MAFLTITDDRTDHTIIYDSVTGLPLPIELFPSKEAAQHFLMWASEKQAIRGGFRVSFHELADLRSRWSDQYIDGGSGELTDAAQAELYEDAR